MISARSALNLLTTGSTAGTVVNTAAAVDTNGLLHRTERSLEAAVHDSILGDDRSADALLQQPFQVQGSLTAEEPPRCLDIAALRRSLSGQPRLKHICHICGRECPSRHKLHRHLSTHTEKRPYHCRICGKAFKWTEYLAKHMRTQHRCGLNNNNGSAKGNTGKSWPRTRCS